MPRILPPLFPLGSDDCEIAADCKLSRATNFALKTIDCSGLIRGFFDNYHNQNLSPDNLPWLRDYLRRAMRTFENCIVSKRAAAVGLNNEEAAIRDQEVHISPYCRSPLQHAGSHSSSHTPSLTGFLSLSHTHTHFLCIYFDIYISYLFSLNEHYNISLMWGIQ